MSDIQPILELVHITKRFGGVLANDAIDLALYPGEILALLGENGAGKTTLMNILYGLLRPDTGEIRVQGKPGPISSPRAALELGIGMVHQHFTLVPTLSVLENVVLGKEPRRGPLLWRTRADQEISRLAEAYQLLVPLHDKVSQLSLGEQQRVEILKLIYRGARILILDEPTASLTRPEIEALFRFLRQMTARGHAVVFISHKFEEVLTISDRIAVLRQGRVVGTVRTREANEQELAYLMVGRDLSSPRSRLTSARREAVAVIKGLTVAGRHVKPLVEALDLQLHGGEIVGVAGVDGNGQTELAEVLAGLRSVTAGSVIVNGQECRQTNPQRQKKLGVAYVPADRKTRGAVPSLSIATNTVLKNHAEAPFARHGLLNLKAIGAHAQTLVDDFDVRCASVDAPAGTLSGGNLQKLILAREVSAAPVLLIAEQPTRGLDIGSVEIVHRQMLQQRERGAAILYLSTDLDEILSISDRIIVMYRGKIVYECTNNQETSRERIGFAMAGGTGR
jgi:simple sugar transport system ATP-binding protein